VEASKTPIVPRKKGIRLSGLTHRAPQHPRIQAEPGKALTARIRTTTPDPFQSYANAIRAELLEAFPQNFDNNRIRVLLATSGRRPWRKYLLTLTHEGRLVTIIVELAI
jgi:hypothetical protein